MSKTARIAHLTDVHLGPIVGFAPRYWNLKRGVGYANWLRKRRSTYSREVLDRIVLDMWAQKPDHVVVTGDLVNIGLPEEHGNALQWLQSLGPPEHVTVIPGNHDIYSSIGSDPGTGRWSTYMAADEPGTAYAVRGEEFPFVRLVGGIALVAINSAVPTPPLLAFGRVGSRQISRVERILFGLGEAGLFRLVLIHHPPLVGQAGVARGLRDAEELQGALTRAGAELVLHGHNHRNMFARHPHRTGRAAIVGAPSASSAVAHGREPAARYNLFDIDPETKIIDLIGRGLREANGAIVELERRRL
jgi:3',5'-cyclic AMP phosphodiesterase CpdA